MRGAPSLHLGLDIGGSKCAALLGTRDGFIVAREEWPSNVSRGPVGMIDELVGRANGLISHHAGPLSVGAAIGGPLDAENGVIYSPPNLPGWDAVPLKQQLETKFGVPVYVEHDASACCLAEWKWGAARRAARAVYLTCGTGFGAGIVVDGRVYRGAGGHPCDFGHIRYSGDGPMAYGKRGSLEAFCSGGHLGDLACWKFPDRWSVPPTGEQLVELSAAGDSHATEVLKINATAIGDACAMLADLLYPNVILLGTLARHFPGWWLACVREQFAAEAHSDAQKLCRIMPAGLGERLQDLSALVVALGE